MGARVYGSLVIIVSAQVLWVLTLGLWTSDLGLTIIPCIMSNVYYQNIDTCVQLHAILQMLSHLSQFDLKSKMRLTD